jgi:hypothetical protein
MADPSLMEAPPATQGQAMEASMSR